MLFYTQKCSFIPILSSKKSIVLLGGHVGPVVVHGHEGGGAHGVADVLQILLTRQLQNLYRHRD